MALEPAIHDGNEYTRYSEHVKTASTFNLFLSSLLDSINPTNLVDGTAYCGVARWDGHSAYSIFYIRSGAATLFTLYAYDSTYVGYVDSTNTKQMWKYTGTIYSLT